MRLLSAETRAQWTVGIVLALIAGYLNGYETSSPGSLCLIHLFRDYAGGNGLDLHVIAVPPQLFPD